MPRQINLDQDDSDRDIYTLVWGKLKYYKEAIFMLKYPPMGLNYTHTNHELYLLDYYQRKIDAYEELLGHLKYN